MEPLRRLIEVMGLLLHHSYTPDDSDSEVFAVFPGKRGGGSPSGIEVKDHRVHRLLTRLEREINYLADDYMKLLEDALRNRQ